MAAYQEFELQVPERAFEVPRQTFEAIYAVLGGVSTCIYLNVTNGELERKKSYQLSQPQLGAMYDVTRDLVRQSGDYLGQAAFSLQIDTRETRPGSTQKEAAEKLHYDAIKVTQPDLRALLMSDINPTVVAVGSLTVPIELVTAPPGAPRPDIREVSKAVERGDVGLAQLMPYRAYCLTEETAHQGAINQTDEVVHKMLIRAE